PDVGDAQLALGRADADTVRSTRRRRRGDLRVPVADETLLSDRFLGDVGGFLRLVDEELELAVDRVELALLVRLLPVGGGLGIGGRRGLRLLLLLLGVGVG